MSKPRNDEFQDYNTSLHNDQQVPATAPTGSEEKADIGSDAANVNVTPNKELEIKPSKTSSTVSLDQRSVHDEEKGLPAGNDAEKEPAVTGAEHDPNIVDWDGDTDPANPLNWTPRKKWYAKSCNRLFQR